MTRREEQVTVTPRDSNVFGDTESHPAFGKIGVYRSSYGGMGDATGASLFDSEIRHRETITVVIREADRSRSNGSDYVGSGRVVTEVEMSLAQWASFVSAMNSGDGVPCTLKYARDGQLQEMPSIPFEPRTQVQMTEARTAARRAAEKIQEAYDALEAAYDERAGRKVMSELMHDLKVRLTNFAPNVEYAGKRMSEHVENVVQKARADVEHMVVSHAKAIGMSEDDITSALTSGLMGPDETMALEAGS